MISPRVVVAVLSVATSAHADSRAWIAGKGVIPSGMQVVGGVNAASLRSSKLYETLMPMVWMQASDAKVQIDGIKQDCGIDILAAIDSIAFGVDAKQVGVIVIALKGTNRKDLEACAQKRAKAETKTVAIAAEGKLTKYTGLSDKPIFVDWLANDVIAIATASDDKDASLKLLGGGIAKDTWFKTALGSVSTTATLWGVYNKPEDIGTQAVPAHMKLAYGNATLANGNVDATVHLLLSDPKEASGEVASVNKQLDDMKKAGPPPALASVVKSLKVTSAQSEVTATVAVPQDDVFGLIGAAMKR